MTLFKHVSKSLTPKVFIFNHIVPLGNYPGLGQSDYNRLKTVGNNYNSGLDRIKISVLLNKHFHMFMDNAYILEFRK